MTPKALLMTLASVLLLAGVILGFAPMKAHGVSCGSALRANTDARVADMVAAFSSVDSGTENACDDKRSTYKPIVWTLLAAGGLLFLVGVAAAGKETAKIAALPKESGDKV